MMTEISPDDIKTLEAKARADALAPIRALHYYIEMTAEYGQCAEDGKLWPCPTERVARGESL